MRPDITTLRTFYRRPIGRIAADLISEHINRLWPDNSGRALLGLGYPTQIFERLDSRPARRIVAMPGAQGVFHWPSERANLAALIEDDHLPFGNCEFDRAILIHAVEVGDNVSGLLRETWRVLSPGGRAIIVVPRRRHAWAGMDSTPFGHGRPFSRLQISTLLHDHLLRPRCIKPTLLLPPIERAPFPRLLRMAERAGPMIAGRFGGVLIVEAEKQLWDTGSATAPARKRSPIPVAAQPV